MSKNNIFIIGFIVLAIVLVGFLLAPSNDSEISPNSPDSSIGRETTLEGEYTCLPHKDTSGPQTLECALGMKTADGSYYAIDSGSNWSLISNLQTGDRIRAGGSLTPIEALSSDHWQKYNVKGVISIKSLNKI